MCKKFGKVCKPLGIWSINLFPEFSVTPAWVNTATETDKKCGLSPKYNSYEDYFKVTPDSYDLA